MRLLFSAHLYFYFYTNVCVNSLGFNKGKQYFEFIDCTSIYECHQNSIRNTICIRTLYLNALAHNEHPVNSFLVGFVIFI